MIDTHQVSPLATCCKLHASGRHAVLVKAQVSLSENHCKAPVVTPYCCESASQDDASCRVSIAPETGALPRTLLGLSHFLTLVPVLPPTLWPRQVVLDVGALVVADAVLVEPRSVEVNGGAVSYQSSSRKVKSGRVILHTSWISKSWSTR